MFQKNKGLVDESEDKFFEANEFGSSTNKEVASILDRN
jgi:hypothetical protein